MSEQNRSTVDRRNVLKLTGAVGITGLAGCIGGSTTDQTGGGAMTKQGDSSSSDATVIRMLATGTSSLSFAASQGIAKIVNENSDKVTISVRPSPGPAANIGALNRDEADWVLADFWVLQKVMNGEDPYGKISYTPQLIHHFYDVQWFLATNHSDWKFVSDISSDARVSPAPRGVSSRDMLMKAMSFAIDDNYTVRSVKHGQMGPALNEDRVDIQAGGFVNKKLEAGWLQQAKSMVNLRILNWKSSVVKKLKKHPGMTVDDIDMSSFEGYAYTPDTLHSLVLPFHYVTKPSSNRDAIYNYLQTFYEQRDADLNDYHALLSFFKDKSYWTQLVKEIPFHPAAADFYQEKGLWSDEFVRGDE